MRYQCDPTRNYLTITYLLSLLSCCNQPISKCSYSFCVVLGISPFTSYFKSMQKLDYRNPVSES